MEVSCIILCTFNDGFVAQRLVPSLLRNSDTSTTEIIVVDNGPAQNLVLEGVLHRLTPKTREEMDKVIAMIDYYNELIDRSDDIREGRR